MEKNDIELPLLSKDSSNADVNFNHQELSSLSELQDPEINSSKCLTKGSWLRNLFCIDILSLVRFINQKHDPVMQNEIPPPYSEFNVEKKIRLLDQSLLSQRNSERRSIMRAILSTYKGEFLISFLLLILSCTGQIITIMLLGSMIDKISQYNFGFSVGYQEIIRTICWFGICYFITQLFETCLVYFDCIAGAKIRLGIIGLIYNKIQNLSSPSMIEINKSKVIKTIKTSLKSIDAGFCFILLGLLSPFNIIAACFILWRFFEAYTIISVICLALFILYSIYLSNESETPLLEKHVITDKRVRVFDELIRNIHLVKMHAWEIYFEKVIETLRIKEVIALLKIGNMEANSKAIKDNSVYLCTLATCVLYVYFGGILNPEKVYVTMLILNYIKVWVILALYDSKMFLMGLQDIKSRIHNLLDTQDVIHNGETTSNPSPLIEFQNFKAYHSLNSHQPCLKNLNLVIPPNKFTVLIGKLGSGKTSFLLSLLKELPKTSGQLIVKGSIAYVEQKPKIFFGSIRENIIFGKKHDKELYKKVCKACKLQEIFKLFPQKDLTIVGKKGMSLNKGQMARISLARAIYSDCDIYLLDDFLSTLNNQVARHIINHAIKSILKDKTIILVTDNYFYAKEADHILVLKDGELFLESPLIELESLNVDFTHILKKGYPDHKENQINSNWVPEFPKEMMQGDKQKLKENKIDGKRISLRDDVANVTWGTYKDYLNTSKNKKAIGNIIITYLISQVFIFAFTRFIGYWAKRQNEVEHLQHMEHFSNSPYIMTSIILCLGILLTHYLKISYVIRFITETNTAVHEKALSMLLKAIASSFKAEHSRKLLDTFSQDINRLDVKIWKIVFELFDGLTYIGFFTIYLCILNSKMIIPCLLAGFLLFKLIGYFKKSIIELKRTDLDSRGTIYSEMKSAIDGRLMIKTYRQENQFIKKFLGLVYESSKAFLYHARIIEGFNFVIKFVLILIIVFGIYTFILLAFYHHLDSGVFGVAVFYLIEIGSKSVWTIRKLLSLTYHMGSAQRVMENNNLPQEAPAHQFTDSQIETASRGKWPDRGEIQFKNVILRHKPNEGQILKGVSFEIPAGSKVGIIARNDLDKSSIYLALFRLAEIDHWEDNYIKIDGVDINDLGLYFLRRNLSIILKTPTIFSDTLRNNLDPFVEFTDAEIWKVLDDIKLTSLVFNMNKKLQSEMNNIHQALTSGQIILLSLARALLRKSRIIVIDEIVENVEAEIYELIHHNIKENFKESTVITITPRLNNIAEYDKFLIIDDGCLTEFDTPYNLLVKDKGDKAITNLEGCFAKIVLNTGDTNAKEIFNLAYQSHRNWQQ